jgi:3-hydroxyacyl-CoA dehydrogenase
VIWLYGYGWPIYRGGPMFWADSIGLKHIADRLAFYAKETNDPNLEPAPLLKRLAAEGKTFASLAAEKSKAA